MCPATVNKTTTVLWNYTWRTGIDEFGEPVHGSQYEALWANGPKEAFELPDYLCDDHFGQELPSFIPRQAVFDYLQGKTWKLCFVARNH